MKSLLCKTLLALGFLAPLDAAPPNILVILTDDLGYSDLGCYGSEIDTPTLDKLAADGLRFSQFYNTAKCHSSRVSLLSGRWCIQAGDISLKKAVIIPEVLKPAGYFTAMTGKWHLKQEPTDFGFERYFGHLSGATSYFSGNATFRLNGEKWEVPKKDFYTTTANVDYAMKFLGEAREQKKPWLLYIAFNAPHGPLQPKKQDYEKYLGRYDVGWDVIHQKRWEKQRELGLFDKSTKLPPRPDHLPAWDSLNAASKKWEAQRMAAYAGLVDSVDQELTRLVENLKANGEFENTLIVFLSDNGACPYDAHRVGADKQPYEQGASWTDSTGWAWARNTPFRFYKQNQFEGGIGTPAIFHWPAGFKGRAGSINQTPAHLVDLLPTIAEVAGAEIPTTFPGREPSPLAGVSLVPILKGGELSERPPIHFLYSTDRGLRMGDWKIVSFREGPWELYDLGNDRTETTNLAAKQPERLAAMVAEWHRMAEKDLKLPPKQRKPVATQDKPKTNSRWTVYKEDGSEGPGKNPKGED